MLLGIYSVICNVFNQLNTALPWEYIVIGALHFEVIKRQLRNKCFQGVAGSSLPLGVCWRLEIYESRFTSQRLLVIQKIIVHNCIESPLELPSCRPFKC